MKKDDLQAASVAFALSSQLVYLEPKEEIISSYLKHEVFKEVPFAPDNKFISRGARLLDTWLESVSQDSMTESVDALQREWLLLFVGLGMPLAPCWESFYREEGSVLFSDKTLAVRSWFRRYGLESEKKGSEPDDHLGLMLSFLRHLIELELEALDEVDDQKAKEIASEQKTFISEHLLSWIPKWYMLTKDHAQSQYYQGIADLVFGITTSYVERFGYILDFTSSTFVEENTLCA